MKRNVVTVGLMGVAILGMASGCGTTNASSTSAKAAASSSSATPSSAAQTKSASTEPPTSPTTTLPLQERNAIRAAKQYLALGMGFSQAGLIQQLSSSAGDGYPLAIATATVDSLNVNWDAQAVLAAKS